VHKLIVAASLSFGSLVTPTAFAAGNAEAGRALAERSCVSCHTSAKSNVASDSAPPLAELMRRAGRTPGTLRAWLSDPHPPMPNLSLTRTEIDNLVAYLTTLQPR
jgi:cytochrome c